MLFRSLEVPGKPKRLKTPKKPQASSTSSRPEEVIDVLPGDEDHQGDQQDKARHVDPVLHALRKPAAEHHLQQDEEDAPSVEGGDGEEVEQPQVQADQGQERHEAPEPFPQGPPGHRGDADGAGDVHLLALRHPVPDPLEHELRHPPGVPRGVLQGLSGGITQKRGCDPQHGVSILRVVGCISSSSRKCKSYKRSIGS